MTSEPRRTQRIGLRSIPMILLSSLYIVICARKIFEVPHVLSESSSDRWWNDLLVVTQLSSSALFFGILGVIMLVRKEPVRRETRLIGWALPLMPTVVLSVLGWQDPKPFPIVVTLIATAFVVVGTGFTIYALRYLGRHFGVVSDVRGLVTDGPYRFVRHPLYGGETLTTIGLVIAVASPITVTAFIVGTILQILRARVEEQSLTMAFPEYRDYAARTPMLIPMLKLPTISLSNRQPADS